MNTKNLTTETHPHLMIWHKIGVTWLCRLTPTGYAARQGLPYWEDATQSDIDYYTGPNARIYGDFIHTMYY